MKELSGNKFRIMAVRDRSTYEGLRTLWCEVFGDETDFVDGMYRAFGADPCNAFGADPCNAFGTEPNLRDSETEAFSGASADRELFSGIADLSFDVFDADLFLGTADIEGFVIVNDTGKVVSALTCYKCGYYKMVDSGASADDADSLDGKPVFASYAICTDPDYRGRGLAGLLTGVVRDIVTGKGSVSLVSPAEASLVDFYKELGYKPHFYAVQTAALAEDDPDDAFEGMETLGRNSAGGSFAGDLNPNAKVSIWGDDADVADDAPFEPGISAYSVDAAIYNRYREEFLADVPHVAMSDRMMSFVRSESAGSDGLYVINCGDAICTVAQKGQANDTAPQTYAKDAEEQQANVTVLTELLVNPALKALSEEIEEELAVRITEHFGATAVAYRTPAVDCRTPVDQSCAEETDGISYCQAMLAGQPAAVCDVRYSDMQSAYFGFPID